MLPTTRPLKLVRLYEDASLRPPSLNKSAALFASAFDINPHIPQPELPTHVWVSSWSSVKETASLRGVNEKIARLQPELPWFRGVLCTFLGALRRARTR